uniref:Uncharacterized protein n=1 Tax=Cannabis sativa TaxID=3483 RepID=A0A803P4N9_CANSA
MMGRRQLIKKDIQDSKNVPHCCRKGPDGCGLLPGTPYNQQIANCCKGGLATLGPRSGAASSFQMMLPCYMGQVYNDFLSQKLVPWHSLISDKEGKRLVIKASTLGYIVEFGCEQLVSTDCTVGSYLGGQHTTLAAVGGYLVERASGANQLLRVSLGCNGMAILNLNSLPILWLQAPRTKLFPSLPYVPTPGVHRGS